MGSSTSYLSHSPEPRLPLPSGYEFLKILGEGSFGKVVKCVKQGTDQTVAIKIGKDCDLRQEEYMLKVLMSNNMHNFNIVEFYNNVFTQGKVSLVFELLDMNLLEYLRDSKALMPLEDIRIVIQQLSTALSALKRIDMIHGDFKTNNIMVVDRVSQPLQVKVVDFGFAIFSSQAKPGMRLQTVQYRAPEIILGLPFSEAIDIWSLGCVMADMLFGFQLFPTRTEYNLLQLFIDLLGPPPDHLINAGKYSEMYFKKTDSDQWMLKTPEQYWRQTNVREVPLVDRSYRDHSLDDIITKRLDKDNPTLADEKRECVELLKAMLKWDERERITPSGILNHPVITKSYLNSSSHLSSCTSETLPAGVIMVRPAAPMNRRHLEETSDLDSEMNPHPAAAPATTVDTTGIHKDNTELSLTTEELSPGIIVVRPAAPMNRRHLEETSDLGSEMNPHPAAAPATTVDTTGIHKDNTELSPTTVDKKKKKNCFKRFFSWMKKAVCCRRRVDVVQE